MRETVLAGFTVPPPNAYGLCQNAAISTAATPYARVRNQTTGAIFPSRIQVNPRIRPYTRVEVLTTNDNPADSAGVDNWLDQRRAGTPTSPVAFGDRNTFPSFIEIYGSFEISPGNQWIDLPLTLAVNVSLWVQSYLTGTMDVIFFWFEP